MTRILAHLTARPARAVIASLIAAAAVVGPATAPAQAATYGVKWAASTVYVYVDPNVSAGWYISYDIATWTGWGINVYRTLDKAKAQIRVHQRDLPSPRAAETALVWSGSTLISADVTLDVTALALPWCSRRHIATHEMGHAMGLAHNTSDRTSLMYVGSGGTCSMYLSYLDYSDMRSLYGGLK